MYYIKFDEFSSVSDRKQGATEYDVTKFKYTIL